MNLVVGFEEGKQYYLSSDVPPSKQEVLAQAQAYYQLYCTVAGEGERASKSDVVQNFCEGYFFTYRSACQRKKKAKKKDG